MDENLAQVMQSMSLEEDVPRDVKTDLMPAGFNGQSPRFGNFEVYVSAVRVFVVFGGLSSLSDKMTLVLFDLSFKHAMRMSMSEEPVLTSLDVPINLPDEDDFIAVKKNSKSLIGRHLNLEVQNMEKMLGMMPKI
ncbi:hypothetical protein F2Q69_00035381 [Brassica cretica]|uniref:Uncharacterized protein n=1 Tax=Brassica cretica TaxID=69181 RepID=A0A8S9SKP2_BRACR|nr:hypothetical protein F2Q69_00035381 [Brassica cretica]